MNIIVTGGAGFIGCHVVPLLVKAGHRVHAVDDLSTGSSSRFWRACVGLPEEAVTLSVVDAALYSIPVKTDVVLNLACPASPVAYWRDPMQTLNTAIGCTAKMGLELMLRTAAGEKPRLVQASTSEIYGDPTDSPQRESYHGNVNPWGPRACYDEGKRAAEAYCYTFRFHGFRNIPHLRLDARVARIFNTYGPGMDPNDGRLVPSAIMSALRNESIIVHGNGTQTRSLCYVEDLADALVRMCEAEPNSAFDEPINLGNPHEVTVNDVCALIVKLTGSKSQIVHVEARTDDPSQRCPHVGRAARILDWSATTRLEDGLQATIEYYRELLQLGDR